MRKALIITYYFPPYAGIEGNRPGSWAKEFSKYEIFPVVVTRHWSHIPKDWTEYYKEDLSEIEITYNDNNRIIRLPYKLRYSFKFINRIKIKFLSSSYYWFNKLIGNLHIETDAYLSFKEYVTNLLGNEKFDLIIVTAPPVNLVKLGKKLSKKFKIPLICDFRDLYDNDELRIKYHPGFSKRINNSIFQFYLGKWLKSSVLITSVCWPIIDVLSRFSNTKFDVVYNGYEEDLFKTISVRPQNEKFIISLVGNLYDKQNIGFMIEAFKSFVNDKSSADVQINFIGVKNNKEVSEKITSQLPAAFINVTYRIQRLDALRFMKASDVLYYIGWTEYRGLFSGKIFEYLGARKNILIAPSDHDVLENLIKETKTGKTTDTVEEMVKYLNNWFIEWKEKGTLQYCGDESKINQYTREEQAKRFAEIINKIFFPETAASSTKCFQS